MFGSKPRKQAGRRFFVLSGGGPIWSRELHSSTKIRSATRAKDHDSVRESLVLATAESRYGKNSRASADALSKVMEAISGRFCMVASELLSTSVSDTTYALGRCDDAN